MVIAVKPSGGDISVVSFDNVNWVTDIGNVVEARAVEGKRDKGTGGRRNRWCRNHVRGFCTTWTSTMSDAVGIPGIRYVVSSNFHILRRLLWTVALLGGMAAASYQVIDRATFFFSNPKSVNVVIENAEPMLFPAVTFCNTNRFRDVNGQLSTHPFGQFLAATYFHGGNGTGFTSTLGGANTTALYLEFAHQMEYGQMFIRGALGGKNITSADFRRVLTDAGVCFTFNSGLNTELRGQNFPGRAHGLYLFLNVEQYYYYYAYKFSGAGILVAVHDQTEIPDMDSMGIGIPPGRRAIVSVGKKMTSRKDGGCVEKQLKYFSKYTKSMCLRECVIDLLLQNCGCVEPYMTVSSEMRVCDPIEISVCVHGQSDKRRYVDMCDCPLPCSTVKFTTSVSYTLFPGNFYSWLLAEQFSTDEFTLPHDFYQENFVIIQMFFEELTVEHREQHSDYTFFALLCDIGGALGLWLGGSILTIVEILDHFTSTTVIPGSTSNQRG
ncbi:acid-sensing ion channel 5-like [Acanthaster planci]|uniref:Acid-sensing ion channel 5-like n=1 Tax=Acanthaster planci TaxID=133434 RepID=A0A8B7ZQ30_ACAPL|nr:acid-sensing ion channel 5-like [Acanthaster planci]